MDTNAYDDLFKKYGERHKIDWLLLKAQVKQESRFNPNAKSPVGALGLAQFMRATWEEWKDGTPGIQATKILFDRTNPSHAIQAQSAYLGWLMERVKKYTDKDIIEWALAMYNWGTRPIRWLKQGKRFDEIYRLLPDETQLYVAKVITYYTQYQNWWAQINNKLSKENV